MPNYTLTLTLQTPAAPRRGRRALAIQAANDSNVTNQNGRPIRPRHPDIIDNPNGTVTWNVSGTQAEVCAMITEWRKYPNIVSVTSNPAFPCPALGGKKS
jgi:hypothetical protein